MEKLIGVAPVIASAESRVIGASSRPRVVKEAVYPLSVVNVRVRLVSAVASG